MRRRLLALGLAALPAAAQAPLLQDGASALQQARRDWIAGEAPLAPSSLPFLEVGWGGAEGRGPGTPLIGGEGLGTGTQGWGLGVQGRYAREEWSFSATWLGLRKGDRTEGLLQRGALAYQAESGWRVALEQAPLAWGSGRLGGDLLGDAARPFPRLSLATPPFRLPVGAWRMEAVFGRLEEVPPIPDWIPDRRTREEAQAAGFGLRQPRLWGGFLRASFGADVDLGLGGLSMEGGRTSQGQPAPDAARLTRALVDLQWRVPPLARLVRARGAAIHAGRSADGEGGGLTLASGRTAAGLQLVWEDWDVAAELAAASSRPGSAFFLQPTYLAGFSTRGDALGAAFGPGVTTHTFELGAPLFLEGRGRLRMVRLGPPPGDSLATGAWVLQTEGQWRTPTGRIGAALASRRQDHPASGLRWAWTLSLFQAFRVF